jgi:hypothetical protein
VAFAAAIPADCAGVGRIEGFDAAGVEGGGRRLHAGLFGFDADVEGHDGLRRGRQAGNGERAEQQVGHRMAFSATRDALAGFDSGEQRGVGQSVGMAANGR